MKQIVYFRALLAFILFIFLSTGTTYSKEYRTVVDGTFSDCNIWEVKVGNSWISACSPGQSVPSLGSNDEILILNDISFPAQGILSGNTEILIDGGELVFTNAYGVTMTGTASLTVINGGEVSITSNFVGALVSSGNNSIVLDGGSTLEIETFLSSSGNLSIEVLNGSSLLINHSGVFPVSTLLSGNTNITIGSGSTFSIFDPPFAPGGDLAVYGNATLQVLNGGFLESESKIILDQNGKLIVDGLGVFENDVIAPGAQDFTTTLTPPEITGPVVYVNGPLGCAGWDGPTGALGDPSCQGGLPLPIVLRSFEASPVDGGVLVVWETVEEENNDYFNIQRSYDGANYEIVGTVDGNGTTTEPQKYTLFDDRALQGTIYYRLVQTDFDGTSETFGPVVVQLAAEGDAVLVYPNPLERGDLTVQLNGFDAGDEATLEIADLSGKTVYAGQFQVSREGADRIIVDLSDRIRRGAYMLRVVQGDRQYTEKLIVTE